MLLLLSFLNGFHHGLGPDHLMAITTLIHRGGDRRQLSWLGLRFGVGHVSLLGVVLLATLSWNVSLTEGWESRAELLGGLMLVLLGAWTLLAWLREVGYVHSHPHTHRQGGRVHSHPHFHFKGKHPRHHLHPHFSSLLGALFALGGVRSLLLTAFPILRGPSLSWALLYVLVFGLGMVASMSLYGWVVSATLSRHLSRGWITLALGLLSLGLGLFWMGTS